MKKTKKLLISFLIVVAALGGTVAKADIIDDCIKCPGLKAIFDIYYKWEMVA